MKSINSKRKNKKKGFTLIEILAVIIIIGIIAIIGVVSVSDYIEDSRKSTYIQQASTYIEAARKLKSSDNLLQDPKNTEALLIPLTSLDLDDSHDYETPYGSIDLNRSYVLITNNNGNYSYYISMIDTTNHSLTVEKQENLNKNNIKTNDDNTIKSIISIKNEVETVDIDGFIYQKSSKNIENSSTILLDCNILDTFKVEVTEAWQNHDKEIKITTINNVSGYQYYLSTRSAKPLKSDANWQKENIFIRGEGHYYAFIKSDEDEISEGKLVIVKNIDMNLPTIKSLVQTPTIPTNGSVVIKGESFDKESGIIGYQFSTNGNLNASSSGWTKVTNSKETLIHNYTVTVNGTYYYYVKDEAGNVAKKSITVTNIDKNAPTIKSLTINPEGWTANDVTITGKSIDTESGIVAYQFSGNGNLNSSSSGWTNITNTKAEVTHTYTVSLNGIYYYYVKDAAGNFSKQQIIVSKIDTKKPETPTLTASDGIASGNWHTSNFTISASGSSSASGITYYYGTTTNPTTQLIGSITAATNTSSYTYYVKACNGAGTCSDNASYIVKLDKTTPTATISATKSSSGTAVSSGSWSNEGLNFKLTTGTVGVSGATIYYCKDTTNTCNPTTVATSGANITSYNTTTGTYYIRYKIVSGAGISSAVASYTAKVDTTTPTATMSATKSSSGTAVSSGSWSNEGLNFKITAASYGTSGAIIYYCKDTTNTCNPTTGAVSGTSITSYNGLTGTYYIRYKIVSGAGKSSAVASYTARVDKTSPTVTISATKSSSGTAVSSDSWSNEGLNFKLTTGTVGGSGGTIYYCQDTANNCNPTTVTTSGSNITSHNGLTGTYYIRYKIVSGAGKSSAVASYTARVDKTPPTISYNLAGGIYNANKTLTITASDTSSGVSSIMVHVYKDGTLLTDRGLLSQTSTNSTSVNMDSDGVWTIYTIAYDNAGNKHTQLPDNGAGFYYQSYTIDKTVPTLTISATKSSSGTAVSSGSWSSEGLNFKLTTGTVGVSGATIYYCKDTANTCNPTTVATSGTAITSYNGTTGTYYIRYKIVSGAGNSSTVASYTAKVDTKKPETPTLTASDGIASGNWHTSNFTISASGSSSTSGITYYYGTTTNPTTQLAGSIGATGDTSSYTYYVKACNGAGICSNNASYTIKLDKTTPTATITATKSSSGTAVSSGSWSNEDLNFKITAASYGTSGAIIYYCKDTTNTCNPTTGAVSGTSITSYNGLTGTYYIRYKIVSGAGKSSAVASYTAKVDKTPPTISYNLAGGTYNTNKTVVVTPNDVGSGYNAMGVQVYKDNQFISNKSTDATTNSTYSVTLDSDGVWAIYTMVYDNAGNKHTQLPDNGAGFYYQVYTIDTTKPSCTLAVTSGTAGNNGWYRSNVTIGFSSSTDNLSGVNSYGIGDYSTKSATLSWDTTGQTYTGYIKDNAGNTNTCSITVKRDTTVPTVGYSLSGGYYNNNQTVTVTANDANFSYMNIQVNNSSGVVLQQNSITTNSYTVTLNSESTWTVYVMAYDAAGNKQTTAPLNEYGWTYQQYVIDKTPPTVSYSLAGGSYTVPQTVTVNAADTGGSGFNYMNVHVYKDGAYVDAKSKNSITSTSYNVTMDSTGSWTIYAAVYDKSGNTQTDKNAYGWYYQSYTINPACERKQSCGCESYNAWQNAGKECVYSASTSTTIRYINCRSDSSYCYSANLHQCQKQTRSCAQYKCC